MFTVISSEIGKNAFDTSIEQEKIKDTKLLFDCHFAYIVVRLENVISAEANVANSLAQLNLFFLWYITIMTQWR